MLNDFFTALTDGQRDLADRIAVEITDIANTCAKSRAAALNQQSFSQDDVMAAMERCFAKEIEALSSLAEAKNIYQKINDWCCPPDCTPDDCFKMATVQHFSLTCLRQKIRDLEIESLRRLCDSYNDALCHDHDMAFKKAGHDRARLEATADIVLARSSAYLSMRDILDSGMEYDSLMSAFSRACSHFQDVILEHPLEEVTIGQLERFRQSLRLFACMGWKRPNPNKAFSEFSRNVDSIMSEKNISTEEKFDPVPGL